MHEEPLHTGRPNASYFARRLYGGDAVRGAIISFFAAGWLYYVDAAAERHDAKAGMADIFFIIGILVLAVGVSRLAAFPYGYLKARLQTFKVFPDRVEIRDALPVPRVRRFSLATLDPPFGMQEDGGYWSWTFEESHENRTNTLFFARKDVGLFGVDKAALDLIEKLRDAAQARET